jgi:hypothetical protein
MHKQNGGGRGSPGGERTIKRSTFSPDQLLVLEESFGANSLPNLATRHLLAEELGLTPRTVQVWFQNRRQKVKKMSLAAGTSTSNDSLSAERSAASPVAHHMPRNSSTGSFDELLNAEFERLHHSPHSERRAMLMMGERNAQPLRRSALPCAAAAAAAYEEEEGGVSLWHADGRSPENDFVQPMPPNFSLTFEQLLGARIEEAAHNHHDDPDASALLGYRRQLFETFAAADRSHADPHAHARSADEASGGGRGAGSRLRSEHHHRLSAGGHSFDDIAEHAVADEETRARAYVDALHSASAALERARTDAQGYDTMDAAANLLLFSAAAGGLLASGSTRPRPELLPVGI